MDRRRGAARTDIAARLAGFACLAATVLSFAGAVSERLDLFANFAPLWLCVGCALTVYGLLRVRSGRWLVLALGASSAALAAILILPEFTRPIPTTQASARPIRIVQFNTWDSNTAVSATADWIVGQRPDVVVVEEAEAPIRSALAARGFIVTPGFGHVSIFSRVAPIRLPAPLAGAEWPRMPPFARATFEDGSGEYTVVGAHVPQPVYGVAAPQRLMLARMLNRYDPAHLIVAGDFNLAPWSFGLRRLDRALDLTRVDRSVWSWPATLAFGGSRLTATPFLPIDHIYAGSAWRLIRLRRGPPLGSDHFPLVVDLSEGE